MDIMAVAISDKKSSSVSQSENRSPDGQTLQTGERDNFVAWHQRTIVVALASALLLWMSFPPLGFWPLAWIAPVGWLYLIRVPRLSGRRPYLHLWIVGAVHWLVLFQFVRIPHIALYFGWFVLAAYLGIYLPLFVAMSRVAVHRFGISSILAAPTVWVGLELLRGHLFSGLSMALLGHTQVELPIVIQISDLAGAYGVSFVVMLVAASLVRMVPLGKQRLSWWPGLVAVIALAAVIGYGNYRLNELPSDSSDGRVLRVALIQGSIDTIFDLTEEEADESIRQSFTQYRELTVKAQKDHPNLDLVVWPESKFPVPDVITAEDVAHIDSNKSTDRPTPQEFIQCVMIAKGLNEFDLDPHFQMLVGTQTFIDGQQRPTILNSALLLDSDGEIESRYFKMHRVPFGEYIFFGDLMPWIYNLTPMRIGLTPGKRPQSFEVAGMRMAPNVCFESTVPHVIRRQIAQLTAEGSEPDFLVNISNDGWFFGSSCLDHHLVCSVFRSVENRKPMLIAANTGFSAWVDGSGRVLKKGPRRDTDVIYAEAQPDGRRSLYRSIGDWPALLCLVFCLVCAIGGIRRGSVA